MKPTKPTPAELMTPRVQVIAPWPRECPFAKDQILTLEPQNGNCKPHYTDGRHTLFVEDISAYSANLRVTPWWEGRAIGELPEYVRCEDKILGGVYKANWHCDPFCDAMPYIVVMDEYIDANNLIPATPAEYQEYQNSKKI